jgi:hypothetical protein
MAEAASDTSPTPTYPVPLDLAARIDSAIGRIEAAVAARADSADALSRRHAALKARMVEAVKALDDVIVRSPAD